MATGLTIVAVFVILGLLLLSTGGAAREGSFRRGVGWYLDVSTPRDQLMGGRVAIPGRAPVSRWSIGIQLAAGVAYLALAIAMAIGWHAWVPAIIVGGLALAAFYLAWDGVRSNRRADPQDGREDDGPAVGAASPPRWTRGRRPRRT